MPNPRYAQLCPLARAAELIGERWTLLLMRELFVGPRRFTDLRSALPGVSPSVLTERLQGLEENGLVEQRDLPPPAASRVYVLTEAGEAFEPALREITRWGMRFLFPVREDDEIDGGQVLVACKLFAKPADSPSLTVRVEPDSEHAKLAFRVRGGANGTHVEAEDGAFDLGLQGPPLTIVMAATGMVAADALRADATLVIDGDASRLEEFPRLFDFF